MATAAAVSTKTWIIGVWGIEITEEEREFLEAYLTDGEFFAEDHDDSPQDGCIQPITESSLRNTTNQATRGNLV